MTNICVHVSLSILVSLVYMPSSGIAVSYGNSITSFWRNHHIVLHSGCTILHFHKQCRKVSFSPYPLQHLLFVDFLIAAICVRWYLTVVLICISLKMSWASFHVFVSHLYVFFGEMSVLCFIFWLDHLFFWNWAAGAAFIFLRLILCQLLHLLLDSWRLSFHLAYSFFCFAKAFKFN